jgi:hypothetical protein
MLRTAPCAVWNLLHLRISMRLTDPPPTWFPGASAAQGLTMPVFGRKRSVILHT